MDLETLETIFSVGMIKIITNSIMNEILAI